VKVSRADRLLVAIAGSVAVVLAACTGAASSAPSPGSSAAASTAPSASAPVASGAAASGGTPGGSGGASSRLAEADAKEALLARFGDLVYCDPDSVPVARANEDSAARDHLPEMRADDGAWAAIAAHLGFDAATTPSGATLAAAYREWKMLRALQLTPAADGSFAFDALFAGGGGAAGASGSGPGQSAASAVVTHVTGTVRGDGTITLSSTGAATRPPCPICLARGTRIATPLGDVPVEDLRVGEPVWSATPDGRRVATLVARVGSMAVPATHEIVHLVLADGRALDVSPGHPLPTGRPVGTVAVGEPLDGSFVVSADRVRYDGGRTFDLLPAGPTGTYWANGVLLGSTLAG
jgi:hypothetical protein